jgi:hypothetical protein
MVGTFLDVAGATAKADNAGVLKVRHNARGIVFLLIIIEESNRDIGGGREVGRV